MSTLTIAKTVPIERYSIYEKLGWTKSPGPDEEGAVSIEKNVRTALSHDTKVIANFEEPWLIQRARINRPVKELRSAAISKAVNLDYMGSTEFEWGALPTSLRCIQSQFDLCQMHEFSRIVTPGARAGKPLIVFGNFDLIEDARNYEGYLLEVINGKRQLKESLRISPSVDQPPFVSPAMNVDFWWDVENHIMFSFDKEFMTGIRDNLNKSFEIMNASLSEK